MTLCIPAKVLLHVCSYDFYDITLSTGKQRRHMINGDFEWGFIANLNRAIILMFAHAQCMNYYFQHDHIH